MNSRFYKIRYEIICKSQHDGAEIYRTVSREGLPGMNEALNTRPYLSP